MTGLPTAEVGEPGAESREVHVDAQQKWFDVRARYLQWTDGRLAQMLIATDVTARRQHGGGDRAPDRARAGHQPPGDDGRDGLVGRARAQPAAGGDHQLLQRHALAPQAPATCARRTWLLALEKTLKQAQRAGQIIHRIRAFVKRSEPNASLLPCRGDGERRDRAGRHRTAPQRRDSTATWPQRCRR